MHTPNRITVYALYLSVVPVYGIKKKIQNEVVKLVVSPYICFHLQSISSEDKTAISEEI